MLNISEYRDLISLFGEFSEKELSPNFYLLNFRIFCNVLLF